MIDLRDGRIVETFGSSRLEEILEQPKDWEADGGCEATDGCWVEPDGYCEHAEPSWRVYLGLL